MTKVVLTNEIAGAMLSKGSRDLSKFESDPKSYILSAVNVEISDDKDLSVVMNSSDSVHLSLPYYSGIGVVSAQGLDNDSLDSVSGGEIGFTIAAIIGAAAISGTLGASLGYAIDSTTNPDAYNADGSIKK